MRRSGYARLTRHVSDVSIAIRTLLNNACSRRVCFLSNHTELLNHTLSGARAKSWVKEKYTRQIVWFELIYHSCLRIAILQHWFPLDMCDGGSTHSCTSFQILCVPKLRDDSLTLCRYNKIVLRILSIYWRVLRTIWRHDLLWYLLSWDMWQTQVAYSPW